DADSEGEEGKFFVWTEAEVLSVLGPEDGRLFCDAYDVTPRGNWEGHNILNCPNVGHVSNVPVSDDAGLDGHVENVLHDRLARCRAKLFDVRTRRIAPGRDDKVLVSWNGLMIAAMSQAASILGEPRYAAAASAAADFILNNMRDADGRLLHSFKDGEARFNAYLDDYACLIDGLVDLYQATFEPRWLGVALELAEQMLSRFEDPRSGGFFYTSIDHEQLVARVRDTQDNATPSGNGMAAYALARLGTLTGRPQLLGRAYATLEAMSGQLTKFAMASGQSLLALDFVLGPTHEIVLVESADASGVAETDVAIRELAQQFWPNKVFARRRSDVADSDLPQSLHELLAGKSSSSPGCTVFVCERGTCQAPLIGLSAWREFLVARD
ncbi:MAG: thioredoxin domain-containing protein, partial [Planctomycetota bacterium]